MNILHKTKINQQVKHLLQKTPATTIDYNAFRKKILNWTLLISLTLGFPAVVVGVIESNQLGQNYFLHFYILVYLLIVILFFLRNKLSSKILIITYLSILYILTLQNLYAYGFIGIAFMLMTFISLMSCAYYGVRNALIALVVSVVPIIIIAYLHWTSTIIISETVTNNTQMVIPWATTIIIYLILCCLLLVTIGLFQTKLRDELSEKTKQAEQLYETNNILEKELSDHKETLIKLKKAKKQAEYSDKLKTAFIENMSHEVRTPLNSIVGFSHLLSPEISMDKCVEYRNIIKNSSNQLITIIEDIIEISEIETQQLKIKKEEINLTQLFLEIKATTKVILFQRKKEHLSFVINPPSTTSDIIVLSDYIRLQQIINKIITNAVKNTTKGFIEVNYITPIINGIKTLQIEIKDSGTGISKKDQKNIFKAFYQIEQDSNRDGNGLGLSITEGLTKMLGGTIAIESQIGKGSTFMISIPGV